LITEKIARRLRELGNVTPLISIEGRELTSDVRRGKIDVLTRTLRGLEHCLQEKILTGVATSVCQSNIDELLTESWLRELIVRGVHYVWYHTYRPVGPKPNFDLALRPDQLVRVRKFVTEMRARQPIAIIDAYYDHRGAALCPMSTGITITLGRAATSSRVPSFNSPPKQSGPRGFLSPCGIARSSGFPGTERAADARLCGSGTAGSGEGVGEKAWGARHDGARHCPGGAGSNDTSIQSVAARGRNPEKHWMYAGREALLVSTIQCVSGGGSRSNRAKQSAAVAAS